MLIISVKAPQPHIYSRLLWWCLGALPAYEPRLWWSANVFVPVGVGWFKLFNELQYAVGTHHNKAELCARWADPWVWPSWGSTLGVCPRQVRLLHTWSLTSVSSDLLLYQYFLLTGCNYDQIPIGCVLTKGKRHERHAIWFMKLNSWSFGLNATTNITKQWPSAWLFLSS